MSLHAALRAASTRSMVVAPSKQVQDQKLWVGKKHAWPYGAPPSRWQVLCQLLRHPGRRRALLLNEVRLTVRLRAAHRPSTPPRACVLGVSVLRHGAGCVQPRHVSRGLPESARPAAAGRRWGRATGPLPCCPCECPSLEGHLNDLWQGNASRRAPAPRACPTLR